MTNQEKLPLNQENQMEKEVVEVEKKGADVIDLSKIGGRLGKLLEQEQTAPDSVMDMVESAMGEGDNGISSEEFFIKAKTFFEKTGLLDKYLTSKGVNVNGNISEWRPAIAAINSGKGHAAAEVRHLDLNVVYNHATKAAIDMDDLYYPVFIHGEEVLVDDSGMNVLDRVPTLYNSLQQANLTEYKYQNVVYLLNRSLTEVYKVTVKSAGHKFVTNILRCFMHPSYSKGMIFDITKLKYWMKMSVVTHTSKGGFINPYVKLTLDATSPLTADEAKVVNVMQRSSFDDFGKSLERKKEDTASANATEQLVEDSTSTDASGADFTNI